MRGELFSSPDGSHAISQAREAKDPLEQWRLPLEQDGFVLGQSSEFGSLVEKLRVDVVSELRSIPAACELDKGCNADSSVTD